MPLPNFNFSVEFLWGFTMLKELKLPNQIEKKKKKPILLTKYHAQLLSIQTNSLEKMHSFIKHFVNDQVTELLALLTVVPNTKTTPKYGATNC